MCLNFLPPLVCAQIVAALLSHRSIAGSKLLLDVRIIDLFIAIISWQAWLIATYSASQVEKAT